MPKGFVVPTNEVELLSGLATVNRADLKSDNKTYSINAENDSRVRFYTNYFPGWQVYQDGVKTNFSYKNKYGYIDVDVPAGTQLSFEDTPIRKIGNLLSVISLFTTLFIAFFTEKQTKMSNA